MSASQDRATLYHNWMSSASWRVRWAVAIKGVAVDKIEIDFRSGEQFLPPYLEKNPIGYVPALLIDGHCLTESVAIMEYLEETRPTPALYPQGARARARVRQLVELVNSGIQPLQNLNVQARHSSDKEERKRWGQHFIARGLTAYERHLERIAEEDGAGRFSVGDSLTAADLCLIPQLTTSRRFEVDLTPYPRVLAVEQAAVATPHAAVARPPDQPVPPPASAG